MNDRATLKKGDRLKSPKGAYKIVNLLGRGSFGQTYRAIAENHPQDPADCAIKQLNVTARSSPAQEDAKRRFQKEAEILEKLGHHPQIPSLWDNFAQNNEFYLVQDFIDGQDLSQEIMAGKRWSEGAVIGLLWDVLQVLEFIQNQDNPCIHRDINPKNLIRRKSDYKIIVIDFGAVKEITATLQGYEPGTKCIGTGGYMPEEQKQGNPGIYSDIYALGITAIFALTGISPYELPYKTVPEPKEVFLSDLSISPNMRQILEKMVRYDYQERYRSATEVLQDLDPLHSIGRKL